MIDSISILAVIPARFGSKGLPRKNILDCAGKPLIAWSIEAALKSKYVTQVLVTTDSEEVANIAKKYGAWVPSLREAYLAQDQSSITEVVKDVLNNMATGFSYDLIVLLQPTSPLRTSEHIDAAIKTYLDKKKFEFDTLVSMYQIDSKCLLAFGVDKDSGHVYSHYDMDLKNPRRQNLPDCYTPNGAIYIASTDNFNGFYSKNNIPFIMNKDVSIDIDCHKDLKKAIKALCK
jgi:CMP-N-acetylneuraminic acid synthetase